MLTSTYRVKGYRIFVYLSGEIQYLEYSKEEFKRIYKDPVGTKVDTSELMKGTQFITDVNCNKISNSDGYIESIYMDGYKTNLGVVSKYLTQGNFMVDFKTLGRICMDHDVRVHWISYNN